MGSVKGIPAYWKQFFFSRIINGERIKNKNLFFDISCADLR